MTGSNDTKQMKGARVLHGALMLLFGALLLFGGARDASAQGGGPVAQLVLRDGEDAFDVGPYMYVTPDPDRTISFRSIIERFNAGQRGMPHLNTIATLGGGSKPQWLVFLVKNESWSENWVLTFGEHLDGRMGVLQDILIYDHASGTRYIDTVSAAGNPYVDNSDSIGTSVKIRIPKGGQAFFIVYAVPEAGIPATIVPQIVNEDAYLERQVSPYKKQNLINLYFALTVGFFITALIFTQTLSAALLALYFILNFVLFHNQNGVLSTSNTMSNDLELLLFSGCAVVGLIFSKIFLDVTKVEAAANRALYCMIATIVIASGVSLFLQSGSSLKYFAMLLPGLAAFVFITVLGFAQAYNGKYAARQFGLSWALLIVGIMTMLLGMVGIIKPNEIILSGYWYGVVAQGVLLMSAFSTRFFVQRHEEAMVMAERKQDDEMLSVLNQSRETGENSRLKRLIEHERQMMNEMREREVRNTEEMRDAMAAADEANRAKSAFLAVVSHEIRTPMTGIMGMVRLLLDSQLNTQQQDYAQTIQDSGDAMLALLNDILDFEKIESGKMDLEYIDFDLTRVLTGIITLMSGHAAKKNITLKAELDPRLPRYVVGDPVRLRQVLLNLTGNSIKFTNKGGVTVRAVVVNEGAGMSSRIRFSVEDTGIGISRDAQKNLFNPFAQADSSVARKFGGTGLGLAISQRLIGAMGGMIEIDSTPGEGSIFFFTLQMEKGSADMADSDQRLPSGTHQKKMSILVVEDNEINQKLLKEFIQRMGHTVTLAGSGEQGMELLAAQAFDLVFMDIELPGMSGMGTTKAIRAMRDRARAATPVIALTGNIRSEDVRAMYAANMNGHVAKPVDPRTLQNMIQKVIDDRLDNPVELPQENDETVTFNKIDVATGALKEPPKEEPKAEPKVDAAPALEIEEATPPVQVAPPISQSAPGVIAMPPPEDMPTLSLEDDFEFDDSFETAIKISEQKGSDDTFDRNLLASLKTTMAPVQLRGLVDELFDKADSILDAMQKAEGHVPDIIARAHELKGMAGNFGLKAVMNTAKEIEDEARASGEANAQLSIQAYAMMEKLPAQLEQAKGMLYAWLSE